MRGALSNRLQPLAGIVPTQQCPAMHAGRRTRARPPTSSPRPRGSRPVQVVGRAGSSRIRLESWGGRLRSRSGNRLPAGGSAAGASCRSWPQAPLPKHPSCIPDNVSSTCNLLCCLQDKLARAAGHLARQPSSWRWRWSSPLPRCLGVDGFQAHACARRAGRRGRPVGSRPRT